MKSPIVFVCCLTLGGACAGPQTFREPQAICPRRTAITESGCRPYPANASKVLRAARNELTDLEPERAKLELDKLAGQPLTLGNHRELFRLRGLVSGYLGDTNQSASAFESALRLNPRAEIPYNLPSEITFAFEEARKRSKSAPHQRIDISWSRPLRTDRPFELYIRPLGTDETLRYARVTLDIAPGNRLAFDIALQQGKDSTVRLPPLARTERRDTTVRAFATGLDNKGNEIAAWASPVAPRMLELSYVPPRPWYEQWEIVVPVGAALVTAASVAVYFFVRGQPDFVDIDSTVVRP